MREPIFPMIHIERDVSQDDINALLKKMTKELYKILDVKIIETNSKSTELFTVSVLYERMSA